METYAEDFPGCCTGVVVASLENDPETLERELCIHAWDNINLAFISCVTANYQKKAEKTLRKLGFKATKPMTKNQHPNTTVRLWWKHIPTLIQEQGLRQAVIDAYEKELLEDYVDNEDYR